MREITIKDPNLTSITLQVKISNFFSRYAQQSLNLTFNVLQGVFHSIPERSGLAAVRAVQFDISQGEKAKQQKGLCA